MGLRHSEESIGAQSPKRRRQMREIKFRGKRLDNGAWVYGSLMQLEGSAYIYDYDIGDNGVSDVPQLSLIRWHADPVTVGQSTGLHDKNGAEIFEGDILKLKDYHGERIVTVSFHNGAYYCTGDGFSDEYLFNSRDREVIGNIHQHPHLLP